MDNAFDEPLFLHALQTVRDLVLIRHEQRATPLERDADLHARETPRPAVDNPADRTRDSAELKHKDVDGREAAAFGFLHDASQLIFSLKAGH